MERYIGEIKIIQDPKFEDIQILWMTREQWLDKSKKSRDFPSVWFLYEGEMYWAISKYEFKWYDNYSDFKLPTGEDFNQWFPMKEEWEYMLKLGYEYRLFDYQRAILQASEEEMDHWCEFELDFIKKWYRDKVIDNLLK
jgi:hypothetical protein